MDNHQKTRLPNTEKEAQKLQATLLGLCTYYAIKAALTTPSNDSMLVSWDIGGAEVFCAEVSPPQLAEPLCRLVDYYYEVAYNACDVQGWRQRAMVESDALRKLCKLTLQQRADQELVAIHSLAKGEATYTYANAIFPLVSQLAGEKPPLLVPPSLEEVKKFFGADVERYYQSFGDEDIKDTIRFLTWLANEANDDQVRTFVSAKCGFGCLRMASLVSKLVNIAAAIGMGKEPSPLELVKQATTNPITEAVLQLASVFQGLGGDTDRATGTLWDAGVHPLSERTKWAQIKQPRVEANRLVVNKAVQDAAYHLLDTLEQYVVSVSVSDILVKGRSSHLLNSIKVSTFHKRIDRVRKAKRKPRELLVSQVRGRLGESSRELSDEQLIEKLLDKLGLAPVGGDPSSDIEYRVLLEEMAREPSLTARERQVLVLMIAKTKKDSAKATLGEIGQDMGITKVRVKELWDSALPKLQRYNPFV